MECRGSQRRAIPATTIQNQYCVGIRYGLFNVPLDDALAQVNGPGNMACSPLTLFSGIHQSYGIPCCDHVHDLCHGHFRYLALCLVDQVEKTWTVTLGHGHLLRWSVAVQAADSDWTA